MWLIYGISYYLTYLALQPIHLICVDERSKNLFVLAGYDEEIEIEIAPNAEVV
ncbi:MULTISPECIES: DUF6888 family protein [unclassified Microcoleus]|uniref:DUF6888 family protein n=1 Tax=unclassified Microcoleus TaxID=2642155 RepID=UPI00403F4F34